MTIDDLLRDLTVARYSLWTTTPRIKFSYGDGGNSTTQTETFTLFKTIVEELMFGRADENTLAYYIRNLMDVTTKDEWETYKAILSKDHTLSLFDFHHKFPDHSPLHLTYDEKFELPGLVHADVMDGSIRVHLFVGKTGYEVIDENLVQSVEFEWLEALNEVSKFAKDDKITHLIGYLDNNIIRIIDIDMPAEALKRRLMVERVCFDILPPDSRIVASDAFLIKSEADLKGDYSGNYFTPVDSNAGDGIFLS